MSETQAKSGDLPVTLATYLYILHTAEHRADHPEVVAACEALQAAGMGPEAEELGSRLVEVVRGLLPPGADHPEVAECLGRLYGADHVGTELAEDREGRLRAIRSYMFQSSLPWIARIIDRFPDGTVGPHWVMVEQVTDRVICMDPYPWDDLDEEYAAPVVEFMVKWELAGCQSIRFLRA